MRLELQIIGLDTDFLTNFNSIKVRLEPFRRMLFRPSHSFQFHKGAIRTIETLLRENFKVFDFNSIKVRLEQAAALNTAADA